MRKDAREGWARGVRLRSDLSCGHLSMYKLLSDCELKLECKRKKTAMTTEGVVLARFRRKRHTPLLDATNPTQEDSTLRWSLWNWRNVNG